MNTATTLRALGHWLREAVRQTAREWQGWPRTAGRNPAWLIALPAAVCLADLAVTLRGQPAGYWQGDYAQVVEYNLVGWLALRVGPWAFALGGLLWVAGFAAFIRHAPRRSALLACLGLIVGHAVGTCSWLPRICPHWFLVGTAFCTATALLARPTWRAWQETWPAQPAPAAGLPENPLT